MRGPKLFKELPAAIGNTMKYSVKKFRKDLDKYLQSVSDEAGWGGYQGVWTAVLNSLTE